MVVECGVYQMKHAIESNDTSRKACLMPEAIRIFQRYNNVTVYAFEGGCSMFKTLCLDFEAGHSVHDGCFSRKEELLIKVTFRISLLSSLQTFGLHNDINRIFPVTPTVVSVIRCHEFYFLCPIPPHAIIKHHTLFKGSNTQNLPPSLVPLSIWTNLSL